MLKIVAKKQKTVSNSRKSSIQTLHADLKRCTTQSTFKNISAGLNKNEVKDSNSSNASLFRRYCCVFLSTLYKSFGL